MARVYWDLNERAAIKAKTLKLHSSEGFEGSIFKAFNAVVKELPLDRQRSVVYAGAVIWLHPQLNLDSGLTDFPKEKADEYVAFLNAKKEKVVAPPQVQVQQEPQVAPPVAAEAPKANVAVEGSEVRVVVDFLGLKQQATAAVPDTKDSAELLVAIEKLPNQIAESVTRMLNDSDLAIHMMYLTDALKENTKTMQALMQHRGSLSEAQQVAAPASAIVETKEEAKERKRKLMILIVNLLPIQFNEIQKQFGEYFDLRSWEGTKGSHTTLKALVGSAYKVYAGTDHIRHSDDTKLSKTAGDRYVRFTGSVSKLRSLLAAELETLQLNK